MQEDKREDRGIAECGPDSVSSHTLNRIQRLKSSPSCHQDEGCSMLRNLLEFVTNDTNDEMNSCGGVSIIEKDSEDRLVRAFLAPPACCTTAKNFLPQVVLDGTFTRGCRGGTFLAACMQDGNTETIVVVVVQLHLFHLRQKSTGHGFATTSSKPCPWTGKQSHSFQTEEQDLYLH